MVLAAYDCPDGGEWNLIGVRGAFEHEMRVFVRKSVEALMVLPAAKAPRSLAIPAEPDPSAL
jgi:hypothetical protein